MMLEVQEANQAGAVSFSCAYEFLFLKEYEYDSDIFNEALFLKIERSKILLN